MHFVSVRELRTQPGDVWKRLAKEQRLIVTRNGKPFALLSESSPTTLEHDLQALRGVRFGRAVDVVRRRAADQGADALTPDDIEALIRDVRGERSHGTGD